MEFIFSIPSCQLVNTSANGPPTLILSQLDHLRSKESPPRAHSGAGAPAEPTSAVAGAVGDMTRIEDAIIVLQSACGAT